MRCSGDPRDGHYHLDSVYPRPNVPSAPEHVPDDLAGHYVEALYNLQSKRFTSAGMMFRKVLEMATKRLAPATEKGTQKQSLKQRIGKLEEAGKITHELRELADCIRDDGNEAAHEEDFDDETASRLQVFTYLFLTYTFTLPESVRIAQEEP